jgi:hypothetical protein
MSVQNMAKKKKDNQVVCKAPLPLQENTGLVVKESETPIKKQEADQEILKMITGTDKQTVAQVRAFSYRSKFRLVSSENTP